MTWEDSSMSLGICCDSRSYNLGLPVCLGVSLTCLTPVPFPEVTWVWLGSKGFFPVPAVRSPEPSPPLPSPPFQPLPQSLAPLPAESGQNPRAAEFQNNRCIFIDFFFF